MGNQVSLLHKRVFQTIAKQPPIYRPTVFAALKKRNSNTLVTVLFLHTTHTACESTNYRLWSGNPAIICEFGVGCKKQFSPSLSLCNHIGNAKIRIK